MLREIYINDQQTLYLVYCDLNLGLVIRVETALSFTDFTSFSLDDVT